MKYRKLIQIFVVLFVILIISTFRFAQELVVGDDLAILNIWPDFIRSNPVYYQRGDDVSIKDIGFDIFAGGTSSYSAYYRTNEFGLPVYSSVLVNSSTNHYYIIGVKI
jgi:hypothetical protein